MDLIRPTSPQETADALAEASRGGRAVAVRGAGRHAGYAPDADPELIIDTTGMDAVVSYEPAEMIAVVEAGMRVGALAERLADGRQEWATDAPAEATVGGVLAVALNSPRRLKVGPIRDSLLEVVLATGDGRLVRGGGRVVKNVTGYDLPRLAVGSLGTLGVITQVAIKVRPLPRATRTLGWSTDDPLGLCSRLLEAVPLPAAVLATPGRATLRLEGWAEEIAEQAELAAKLARPDDDADTPLPAPWTERPHQIECSVPPSQVMDLSPPGRWGALLGVGTCWAGADDADQLASWAAGLPDGSVRRIAGEVTLPSPTLPARDVQRRLKRSFDPADILPAPAGLR